MDRKCEPSSNASNTTITTASTKRLTVQQVLRTEGFEEFTEEQAERYIDDLERYCTLMYQLFQEHKSEQDGR